MLQGVFSAKKKDGTVYYRASITYHTKHISLGSFPTEETAHRAYLEADTLLSAKKTFLPEDYSAGKENALSFAKWISLINFKNNGFYIKTPIYLQKNYFYYYLSPTDILTFDADDLFYYSNHAIMRRGNHLFVSEYGMQTNIHTRYGIKSFARPGTDYRFVNGDANDFRYSNIEIWNTYHGVTRTPAKNGFLYIAKIHIRGNFLIGRYETSIQAAVAYNKAADILHAKGLKKHFEKNYIEQLDSNGYRAVYETVPISRCILNYAVTGTNPPDTA